MTKEDNTFLGWFDGDELWSFDDVIDEAKELVAHWASTVWDVAEKVSPH